MKKELSQEEILKIEGMNKRYFEQLAIHLNKSGSFYNSLLFCESINKQITSDYAKATTSDNLFWAKFYESCKIKMEEGIRQLKTSIEKVLSKDDGIFPIPDLLSTGVPSYKVNKSALKHPNQIQCSASEEEISYFFSILANEINPSNNKPYMKKADIDIFTRSSFVIYGCPYIKSTFDTSLTERQKGRLMDFLQEFFERYDRWAGDKIKYPKLLKSSFTLFADDNLKSLYQNMRPTKRPILANRIPVWKYLPPI